MNNYYNRAEADKQEINAGRYFCLTIKNLETEEMLEANYASFAEAHKAGSIAWFVADYDEEKFRIFIRFLPTGEEIEID